MKKTKIFILTFICALSLVGCKKNHHCYCGTPTIDVETVAYKDTKTNAEKKCEEREAEIQKSNPTVNCEIR